MTKMIPLTTRPKNQKFICTSCKKECYCIKFDNDKKKIINDYNFCPYCGEKVETVHKTINSKEWDLTGDVYIDFIEFMEERGFG